MEVAALQNTRRNNLTPKGVGGLNITIVPYTEDLEEAVRQFNRKLKEGGADVRFPESHVPEWLPRREGSMLFQEYYLAMDDGVVRGGYILKSQDFLIGGKVRTIADLRLPLSEGIVNPDYNFLGLRLVMNALARQPLLFALGMGGYSQPLPQMLKAMRWSMGPVPFLFLIVRPAAFLRNIAALRTSKTRRFACDVAACTGLGSLAWRLASLAHPSYHTDNSVTWEEVDEFGPWVDEIWKTGRTETTLAAVRDAAVVRTLYPPDDHRFIRLKISRNAQSIGWAVGLATQMESHKQFGNMKVGTLVDGFSTPANALDVVSCTRDALENRGVDLIVSNQSHTAWSDALSRCGFRQGPTNFLFAASPKLARLVPDFSDAFARFHVNRGDGDGPIHL